MRLAILRTSLVWAPDEPRSPADERADLNQAPPFVPPGALTDQGRDATHGGGGGPVTPGALTDIGGTPDKTVTPGAITDEAGGPGEPLAPNAITDQAGPQRG